LLVGDAWKKLGKRLWWTRGRCWEVLPSGAAIEEWSSKDRGGQGRRVARNGWKCTGRRYLVKEIPLPRPVMPVLIPKGLHLSVEARKDRLGLGKGESFKILDPASPKVSEESCCHSDGIGSGSMGFSCGERSEALYKTRQGRLRL
jgi:hypothetical protein